METPDPLLERTENSSYLDLRSTQVSPSNQPEAPTPFLQRKEKAIAEDLRTAFSGYERLVKQVDEIRRWTVTTEVAAIGFLLTGRLAHPAAAVVPAGLALFAFMVLELRARSSMRFNKDEVLKIEEMLMLTDDRQYYLAVKEYKFRDLRLVKLDRSTKLFHLMGSCFDLNIGWWYGVWALTLVIVALQVIFDLLSGVL